MVRRRAWPNAPRGTCSTAEARLRAAAEALPDGLVVFDRHDRIAFYNSRFPELMTEALSAGLAIGKPFDDWIREGMARGPVLPSRDGRRTSSSSALRSAPTPRSEHSHPPRRRALGAHPREPDRGRRPGASDHRHHRGAPPRRRAAPAGAGGGAGRRPGGDHRRRPRLHLRQPRLRDHDRLHPGRGAGPRAAGHPVERDAAAGVLRRDAPRARGRAAAGRARSSTATATAT